MNALGFVWYLWAFFSDVGDYADYVSGNYDFNDVLNPFQQWANDYQGLPSALTAIGNGIANLFLSLPPLFVYLFCISFTLLLMSLVIRIVIDFL